MEDLSLHVLDIAENSVRAGAKRVTVSVLEDTESDTLRIRISDNGPGIDPELLSTITDPFVTSKGKKTGLGLSLLKQSAEESMGEMTIHSTRESGTEVEASFQISHPDRKPLGRMDETIMMLVVGNPGIEVAYSHCVDSKSFEFDSSELDELGIPRDNLPEIISFLRKRLSNHGED
jgi:anti-sigma regulatory factor (Ser/Thr protein kinase)